MDMVGAYLIKDKIYMQGYATTTDGLSMLDGIVLTSDIQFLSILGEKIETLLKLPNKVIPHPTQDQWKDVHKNSLLLQEAHVKNWKSMMENSRCVLIDLKTDKVVFTPHRLRAASGKNRGYDFLEDKAVISDLDPENLGHALLEAFERCE